MPEEQGCVISDPMQYVGVSFLILGWLAAGALILVAGVEQLNENGIDFYNIEIELGIASGALMLAMIGYYFCSRMDGLCGGKDRDLAYFGRMFILLGFLGVAGFTLGKALNFDVEQPGCGTTTRGPRDSCPIVQNVVDYSYILGVFLIIFFIGYVIANFEKMTCDGDCQPITIGRYMVTIFLFIAAILYFVHGGLADEVPAGGYLGVPTDEVEGCAYVSIVIGVCYVFISLGFALINCFCCGGC